MQIKMNKEALKIAIKRTSSFLGWSLVFGLWLGALVFFIAMYRFWGGVLYAFVTLTITMLITFYKEAKESLNDSGNR